jgi:hypothetical protein
MNNFSPRIDVDRIEAAILGGPNDGSGNIFV